MQQVRVIPLFVKCHILLAYLKDDVFVCTPHTTPCNISVRKSHLLHPFFVFISTQTKTFFPRGREELDPITFTSLNFAKICDQALYFLGKVVDKVYTSIETFTACFTEFPIMAWGPNVLLLPFQDLSGLDQYRAMLKGVNDYISDVENKVTSKLETIDRFADPQEEYKMSQVNAW